MMFTRWLRSRLTRALKIRRVRQNKCLRRRPAILERLEDRSVLTAGFTQGFEVNNAGWDVFPGNNTALRVPSGTDGVTSRSGSYHAEAAHGVAQIDGDGSAFTRFGGYTTVFPPGGFRTSVSVYLDAGGAFTNDTRFDWDSAISDAAGGFRRDFVFNGGYYNDTDATGSGPRFVFTASNNAGRSGAFPKNPGRDPFSINTTGWYTFEDNFTDAGGGVLKDTLSIKDTSGSVLHSWVLSDPSDVIGSTVGGNRYGWFVSNEFPFLAIDDSYQLNNAPPNTVYVDDDWAGLPAGGDPDGAGPATSLGYDAFATIQGGVNGVATDGTVKVAAGTYHELVQVNKTVSILGAQAGVDARGPRGSESIVSNGSGDFQILADNVTIDGFTLTGVTTDPNVDSSALGAAIWTNPGFSGTHGGHQLLNNIIQGNIAGIELDNDGTFQTKVQHNLFKDNTQPGPAGGLDIVVDFGLQNALIDANTFTNTSFVEDAWALGVQAPSNNITFSHNTVNNHGRGVYFYGTSNVSIHDNTINGATHYAIGLFGGDSNVQVLMNNLSNNTRGLDIENQFGGPNSSVTAECNNFAGDSEFGLGVVGANAYTGSVDASPNWWGSATGPTIASNPGGTGSKIRNDDAPAVTIVYSPWAADPSCTVVTTGPNSVTQQSDPCDPTKQAIVVVGTSANDNIEVKPKGSTQFEVKINGKSKFIGNTATFAGGHIIVYAGAGNDHVTIDPKILIASMIFGEAGKDELKAGGGSSVLVGGDGDDTLKGGKARDILIGGLGKDNLRGDGAEDLLIAGTTDFDTSLADLCLRMDDWLMPTPNYSGFIGHVHDDGVKDDLDGQAATDVYFANKTGTGNAKDNIHSMSGETVNDTNPTPPPPVILATTTTSTTTKKK